MDQQTPLGILYVKLILTIHLQVVPLSIVFSCTKPHIETTFNFPTESHISMDSPMHNLNLMTIQPMNVQQNVDLIPIETASPELHHQKVLESKQPPSKKIKLFKFESNDKKLKSTSFTLEDSSWICFIKVIGIQ